jgi:6-phosphogluconolactonase (cycloisomerase 2 family)
MALHIHNTANVSDDATLELDGAVAVTTAVVGGTTYLFVTGRDDDGVSVFSVADDGTLANVDNVSDDATLELAGPGSVTTAVVGGTTYLFVTGIDDSGVSVFSVADDGTLANADNVSDDATLELNGARDVTTAVVGGTTYLFVTGINDNGVSVFSVADDGTLTNVDNVTDDATLELRGARGVTTAVVGGTTYLFVTGFNDSGVGVFAVAADGTLSSVDNVTDDAALELFGAAHATTAVVGGTTHLFVTGFDDDGVSVFSVAADGTLTNVDNVSDDATLELVRATGVTTAVVGGTTYLLVTGSLDDGVSVFSVAAGGTLANVDNVSDDATLELDGASGVTTAVVGGIHHLFVTGFFDDGVSAFALDGNVPLLGDVLWRHSDGTAATAAHELGSLPNTWQIDGTGDFDGDGDTDVLWRHDDGQTVTWETQNGAFVASHDIEFASINWRIEGTGDFDGDGDADIVWRHRDGAVVTWEMDDGAYVINHNHPVVPTNLQIDGTGDFDGDGDDDIVWRHDEGQAVTWEMQDGAFVAGHDIEFASINWQVAGTGDFDRDGDADILWQHEEGAVTIWEMENNAYVVNRNQPDGPTTGEIAGTHDFDGDGDADILWRQDDGQVITWEIEDLNFVVEDNFGAVSSGWQIRGTGEFDLV